MNPRTLDSRVSPRPIHPHPHPRPVKMPRSPGGAVAVVPGSVLPAYPDSPEVHFSPGPFLTPLFLASLSVFGAQQHLPAFPTSCLRIRAWARLRVCECVCAVCTCRMCGVKAGSRRGAAEKKQDALRLGRPKNTEAGTCPGPWTWADPSKTPAARRAFYG